MIETLTIITLSVLALIFFRPGKTEPLKNPLVINRGGQFHAVLAPMLNLSQPLLESISRHLNDQDRQSGNSKPLYLMVSDREVKAHGDKFYLLAVTLRDGVLYCQAIAPQEKENHLDTIRAFSDAEMFRHPETRPHSDAAQAALAAAIQAAADQRGAILTPIAQ
ncbi:MAG: hypothetical protein ACLQHK_04085 [Gallionellaceae bacterium]